MSSLYLEIKELIVESLQLDEVKPSSISDTDPLFGEGLGLDSIDALELATAISRKYNIKVSQDESTREAFRSVKHLAEFVEAQRAAGHTA